MTTKFSIGACRCFGRNLFLSLAILLSLYALPVANADVIIDNGNTGTSFTGIWQVSGATGYYGTNSLWSRNGATYTWAMSSQPAGTYEVLMWWASYSSRSTNAAVDITHSSGTNRVYINQQLNGGQWNSLGQFYFSGNGSVRINATAPSPTSYCADAVWFKQISTNSPPTAIIDSITPNPATPGTLVTFTGHGTDIGGSITGYEWQSNINGILSNADSFSASDLSTGTHTISFRVQDDQGTWSTAVTNSLVIGVIPTEIIIDNSTANTTSTGTWQVSGSSGYYGSNSIWSRDGATYTWRFTPPQTGQYEVSMWWTIWPSRSTSIPVAIRNAGSTATVTINQQQNGSQWNRLGEYAFNSGTTYNITMTSQPGPSSTNADAVRFIRVGGNLLPTAAIDSIIPNPAKPGDLVEFTGYGTDSDGTVTGYEWQSNLDGILSDADSFSKSDLSEGTHTISFKVQDNAGAWSASVTSELIIGNASPIATIDSIIPNPAKPGELVQFTGHGTDSDGSIAAYEWQSNLDGILSDANSFSKSDLSEGTHTISFRVQDDTGAWSVPVTSSLIIGNLPPIATIDSVLPNPAMPGEAVQFTGHGTDSDGSVTGYEWQSNIDGILSNANSFSDSGLSEGTHTISFRVQDDTGDWSAAVTNSLVVGNIMPTAYIDSITPNPATVGHNVVFTGHGVDSDGSIADYNWTSSIDGFLSNQASFSTDSLSLGDHTITFTVEDDWGGISSQVTSTLVIREAPSNIEHIYACYMYSPGYGQGQFRQMLRDIGAYQQGEDWIYETSQKTFIVHFPKTNEEIVEAFETEGAHIIMHSHSNYGLGTFFATDQEIMSQTVDNLRYIDDDRMLNCSSPWISISTDGMRTSQQYPNWWPIFKDGTSGLMPYDFNDPRGNPPYNYYHTYQVPGDPHYYKIETVRNSALTRFFDANNGTRGVPWYSADGAEPDPNNPEHRKYFITNTNPWSPSFESVGNWTGGYQIYNVENAQYFKENYIYSNAGNGSNTAKWMFTIPYAGNYNVWAWWPAASSRSSAAPYTVNHALGSTTVPMNQTTNGRRWNVVGNFYFDANSYSTILRNNVASGNVAADGLKITHADNPPEIIQADFYTTPRTGTAPFSVVFENQSTGDYTARTWSFGDGQSNTTRDDADHIYTRAGTYTVTLTVSGPLGSSTRTKTAYIIVGNGVIEPLRAEFSASSRQGIIPRSVRFRDRSSSNAVSWLWNFGDGNTSTAQSPTYVYKSPGNYTVSLTVTDSSGNSATETKTNFVRTYIFEKIIDNVDYPKNHYGSKVIVYRKELEVNPAEFKYSRFALLSCNSGNYYPETFHHGVFFYSLVGSNLSADLGFALYLRPYLEGRSDQYIWQQLQNMLAGWDYFDFTQPPPTQQISSLMMAKSAVPSAAAVEPVQTATVSKLDAKKQDMVMQKFKKMSLEKVFESLKDVEYMTNNALMERAVTVAFANRKEEAINLAVDCLRLPVTSDTSGDRVAAFFVAKKVLKVFGSEAADRLLELYQADNTTIKGNVIQVAGGMADIPAMKKLLVTALDDTTLCEDKTQIEGEYLRICDLAYNQLVLCNNFTNVLRTIGTMHTLDVRDYHIKLLKGRI